MPLIEVVCTVLSKNHSDQCLLCLDLVNVLLEIRGKDVITVPELRNVLIETLKRENDDVIDYDLRVLVKYVQYSQELTSFIRHILKVGVGERCEPQIGADHQRDVRSAQRLEVERHFVPQRRAVLHREGGNGEQRALRQLLGFLRSDRGNRRGSGDSRTAAL